MVWNAAHLHLMLNHVPILGFAFALLTLGWGWWRGSDDVVRAAFGLFLLTGLASVATFLTGEGAEEIVERVAGVGEDLIHPHEEAGERAMIVAVVVAVLAGFGFVRYRTAPVAAWIRTTVFVGGLVGFALLAYAGLQGGQIRHEEIRPGVEATP
jgi:uncharacterized membrane protein